MPLTVAAQAVQRSAYPDAYGQWEGDATALVAISIGAYGGCNGGDARSDAGETLPDDFSFAPDTPLSLMIAIAWALQILGTPYSFGGSCTDAHGGDPAKQCDCSSLVQQAYRAAGIALPRVTEGQQHAGTAATGLSDIRPGDLIFIPGADGTMSDPGHVGLYIGHNLLAQAPHTGDVVKLTNIATWVGELASIRQLSSCRFSTYLAPSQRSGTVVGACARSLKRRTDFDSTVVGIVAQPFQLSGMDGDALRRHVPDLRLGDADGGIAVGR